ncbi:MAG: Ig-like domain-containing protein, partial [Candidatus Eremiobacteraeota bacterium]|nr:Ig-like domain-containing protein [Candidatus Eremiobacteraeota bacterium]
MRRFLILLALSLLCGCLTPSERALGSTPEADRTPGFEFTLSDGSEAGKAPEQLPVPKTTPLTAEATKALLDRLPKLPQLTGDKTPFAKREDSKPLPRTGKTVEEPFPPAPRDLPPVETTSGPVQVVRYSPEGDVELAPFLSVTFNQPMIAVSSQTEASQVHPVKLTPEPPGEWRWVGTKTLLFKPKPRFPMATKYQVEIPAGTASQSGQKLAAAKTFTFTTPAPRLLQKYPEVGPTKRDPLIFLGFDQAIDAEKMSQHLTIKAGDKTFPFRLATAAARAEDAQITSLVDQAEAGRWLVIQPSQPLPLASNITVTVEAGAPSQEGPSTTSAPQSFSFSTYSPLKIVDQNCDPGDQCPPLSPWWVEFNNPLDEKNFLPAMVTVSPDVPGFKVEAQGSYLRMRGRTKGNTTYTVTIHKRLGDVFGQFLGEPQEVKFHVGRANKMLRSTTQGMTVLDPYAKPSFPVYTVNVKEVRVLAYALSPQDWLAFGKYYHGWRNEPPPPIPGRQVLNTTVQIKADPDELVETNLDLSKALPDKFGQLAVIVEDTDMPPKRYEQRRLVAWVQATNIGLDAMLDGQQLVALTTDLHNGKPLQGVELSISETAIQGQSGDNGMATLDLPAARSKQTSMLVARQGKDLAILPEHAYFYESQGNWLKRTDSDSLLWYVVDDRQMYRPGEKVSVKGWIRRMAAGPKGDLEGPPTQAKEVSYVVYDSRNNKIGEGKAALATTGGFDFNFQLPGTPNLGYARIELTTNSGLGNSTTSHGFQIQEFRRPEFEVTSSPSDGPHMLGGEATVTVHANYYAGGGLPNAEVNWSVSSSPGSFSPPNHSDFTFGRWTPWWDMGPWWRTPENPYNSKSL